MSHLDAGEYLERVQEDMGQVVRELLAHTERLTAVVRVLEAEKQSLVDEVDLLRQELTRRPGLELPGSDDLEEENRRLAGRYGLLEQQGAKVATLRKASRRLIAAKDRRTRLEVVRDIVQELIGIDRIAIFEPEGETDRLMLVAAFGMRDPVKAEARLGEGPIGRAAETGMPVLRAHSINGDPFACFPIAASGGVIALYEGDRGAPETEIDCDLMTLIAAVAAGGLSTHEPSQEEPPSMGGDLGHSVHYGETDTTPSCQSRKA